MKKFLSLVLALVMTMSLVTISAGAKDFNDNADVNYKEAVAVVSEAGIIDGYTDGSFRPEAKLTRGAAAKIICNMILGPTTAAELAADTAPYPDVPTNHTFAGYIAYCQKEGIISGYADGNFYPASPLTGYAFWKMLLGALGYNSEVEGFVGANWSINVAKQGLAIGLDDDMITNFNGTAQVTREEACLYALNTLQAVMVDYSQKTEVNTGNAVVTISGNRYDVENTTKTNGNIEKADKLMEFAEKYFEDLEKKSGAVDGMGRPSTRWDWDGEEIGTYAKAADETYVLNKTGVTAAEVLVSHVDYMELDEDDFAEKVTLTINGMEQETADVEKLATKLEAGDTIMVFENDDDDYYRVAVVRYTVAKIDDVDDEPSSSDAKKGANYAIDLKKLNDNSVTVATGTLFDKYTKDADELKGFNAETYVEDAVIAAAIRDGDIVLDSYIAEIVTGQVSSFKEGSKPAITVDGTTYPVTGTCAKGWESASIDWNDSEYTIYLDSNGYVIGIDGDTAADLDEVYYVTYAAIDTNKYGVKAAYAQAVALKDGSVAEFELTDDAVKALGLTDKQAVKGLYSFDEDDGEYDIVAYTGDNDLTVEFPVDKDTKKEIAVDVDLKKSDDYMKDTGSKLYFDDETLIIKVEMESAKNIDVSTSTGSVSAEVKGAQVIAVYSESGSTKTAERVVIASTTEIGSANSADDIIYITDSCEVKNTDGWEIKAYFVDGTGTVETITYESYNGNLAFADKGAGKITKDNFFEYTVDDEDLYDLDDPAAKYVLTGEYDDETGYVMGALLTNLRGEKLSAEKGSFYADDVKLAENVIIIDERSSTDRDADGYKSKIENAAALESAMDKDDWTVSANIFFDDEEVILVAVTKMEGGKAPVIDDKDDKEETETVIAAVKNGVVYIDKDADIMDAADAAYDALEKDGYTDISVDLIEGKLVISAKKGNIGVAFDVQPVPAASI